MGEVPAQGGDVLLTGATEDCGAALAAFSQSQGRRLNAAGSMRVIGRQGSGKLKEVIAQLHVAVLKLWQAAMAGDDFGKEGKYRVVVLGFRPGTHL